MVMDRIEVGRGEFKTAIVAENNQALTDLLGAIKNKNGEDGYFEITMPCGYSQVFKSNDDIPTTALPCPCGQGEYLIEYKEDNNGHGNKEGVFNLP